MAGQRRVTCGWGPEKFVIGMRLVAPRKRVTYKVVRVTKNRIFVVVRRGQHGRFSRVQELVPSEVIGFRVEHGA